ncbi:phage baseplate assembly protein [Salinicola avicenniae]|uniref:phage baseplate assembly protein n=1 Tax=Salinicola avicenniae TaxID=2916836 RepID=UPI0020739E1E|nr:MULTISPECIES: hypothetical protein [unclassified Salinicola]
MADELELTVNGGIYGGWESVEISRSVETVAGGFRIGVTDRWQGQAQPWPIRRGDACRLAINGAVVIEGYVDKVSPALAGDRRVLTITGRDRTADLVDCSAVHSPGEWAGIGLLRLAQLLCQPFGIDVASDVSLGAPFAKFAIQPGETVWEALERACRLRAVLATADGAGGVRLTRAGAGRSADDLRQGENLLAASADLDMTRRFSQYLIDAQTTGSDYASGETVAEVRGVATDAGVPRYRPLLVMAEGTADNGVARQRAEWEATVRAARGDSVTATVQGWTQRDGSLWLPNQRVRIVAPWLRVSGEMLIAGVTYRKRNDEGTTAELQLMRPDALTPEPEVPSGASSGGSGSQVFADWLGGDSAASD